MGSNLKLSENVIELDDGAFKGSTTPTFYLGTYICKYLNTEKIKSEELFNDAYVEKVYES